MTASYGQGNKLDSKNEPTVSLGISDYEIFCECCIRQTGLEKDTTTTGIELRDYKTLTSNYLNQITNLELTNKNSEERAQLISKGLDLSQKELNKQRKINKFLKIGLFRIGPAALIGGTIGGFFLGKSSR